MDDLHDNAKLRPIIDDGEGDIPLWNKMIARYLCVGPSEFPTTRGCFQASNPYLHAQQPRQGFYERPVVVRRGVQVPSLA